MYFSKGHSFVEDNIVMKFHVREIPVNDQWSHNSAMNNAFRIFNSVKIKIHVITIREEEKDAKD